MKRTSTYPPVIPEGWMKKPPVEAYNFLDWAVKFQKWTIYINTYFKEQLNNQINDYKPND
jgi:hypothetical protein